MSNVYTQRNKQVEQKDRKEELRIEVEKIPFESTFATKRTTTVNLASQFNKIFRPIFSDFEGTIILPNQNVLTLTIYFTDKGPATDGTFKAVTPIGVVNKGSSFGERIKSFNARNKMHTYDLTQEAKEMLGDLIYTRNNQKIKWDQYIIEQPDNTRYGQYNIVVGVINLDVVKVLRKLYSIESEGRADYDVKIVRQLSKDNFLIDIVQLDTKEVEVLASETGMAPMVSGFSIVR